MAGPLAALEFEMPENDDLQREKLKAKIEYIVSQRDQMVAADAEHWKSHDQAILTLSSAAFGISLTLLYKSTGGFTLLLALYVSWILLIVAIVSTLISFRRASAGLHWEIKQLDDQLAKIREAPAGPVEKNPHSKVLSGLNLLSAWSFGLALCALATFATANFAQKGELWMSNNPPSEVKKGAPVIQPPRYPDPPPTNPNPAPPQNPPAVPAKK
jgi:hypothetical protein